MSDYFTVRCGLCLGEDGQPWTRTSYCRECAEATAAAHPHPCSITWPPPEVSTRTVQTLLRRLA